MADRGVHSKVMTLLAANNALGGYQLSLICTEQGLLIASAGEGPDGEALAAFSSLFDEVVRRAVRDLGFGSVEEVTLLDPALGRFVIRPLTLGRPPRLFLLVLMDAHRTWRRNLKQLGNALAPALLPLADQLEGT